MKWHAVKDKSGAYEVRQAGGEIFGGIMIDGKNRGIGFVGSPEVNRYIFEYEEGIFNKHVVIYAGTRDNRIASVRLGFMDSGTLETGSGNFDWKSTGSSKVWTNKANHSVLFLDLENETEKPVAVLSAADLDDKTRELLILCGWYLLVIEYRAGFTNSKLAGMPVKTAEFRKANGQNADWWDVILDISFD